MIPPRVNLGQRWAMQLSSVLYNYRDFGHLDNTIMGYKIPSFQRPIVWKLSQQILLIESLYLGYDVGTFTVNENEKEMYNNFLIDGQQRLFSIQEYINDKFPVFGFLYSELDNKHKSRFFSSAIGKYVLESDDFNFLKQHYNRLNFGGTPHKESEKA